MERLKRFAEKGRRRRYKPPHNKKTRAFHNRRTMSVYGPAIRTGKFPGSSFPIETVVVLC